MVHGLRDRSRRIRVPWWSFSSRPRIRPENALLSGLFFALPRSYSHLPVTKPEPLLSKGVLYSRL